MTLNRIVEKKFGEQSSSIERCSIANLINLAERIPTAEQTANSFNLVDSCTVFYFECKI